MQPQDKTAPRTPTRIHPTVFIAETATVVGDVTIHKDASVWFSAVLRGDGAPIVIGDGTNVQDGVIIHVDPGFPTTIGRRVTIGHNAVVHGATIGDDALIGIGAIVLNGAKIGEHALIAAGALVPEGMEIPARSLVMGVPGKVVRPIRDAEVERMEGGAVEYIERARNYWKGIYK